jgi:predicted transcriptional regulator
VTEILPPHLYKAAATLWKGGSDTKDIAYILGVPEPAVLKTITRQRDARIGQITSFEPAGGILSRRRFGAVS